MFTARLPALARRRRRAGARRCRRARRVARVRAAPPASVVGAAPASSDSAVTLRRAAPCAPSVSASAPRTTSSSPAGEPGAHLDPAVLGAHAERERALLGATSPSTT